ncbi:MAG: DUF4416 family protein [Planctomycetota bacterium]
MTKPTMPEKAKLFVGMISIFPEIFEKVTQHLIAKFGVVDLKSEILPFDYTDYYNQQMGENLKRKFVAFENLIEQNELAEIKLFTNDLEGLFKGEYPPERPINLDPGIVVKAKIILASCKDFSHRIHLAKGVYGEVTLQYYKGKFKTLPWTYPDFRSKEYQNFFLEVRKKYVAQVDV